MSEATSTQVHTTIWQLKDLKAIERFMCHSTAILYAHRSLTAEHFEDTTNTLTHNHIDKETPTTTRRHNTCFSCFWIMQLFLVFDFLRTTGQPTVHGRGASVSHTTKQTRVRRPCHKYTVHCQTRQTCCAAAPWFWCARHPGARTRQPEVLHA